MRKRIYKDNRLQFGTGRYTCRGAAARAKGNDNRGVAEWILVLAVGVLLMATAAVIILRTRSAYRASDELYARAQEQYVKPALQVAEWVAEATTSESEIAATEDGGKAIADWAPLAEIQLEELSDKYPDVVGWIYFENEDISYPMLFSGDNVTYLRRSFEGKYESAGSIFLDGRSAPDFSNLHTVIYGHNMRNLSMFGKLRYYRTEPDYYAEHQYFQIFMEDKVYRYRIYAYEELPVEDGFHEVTGESEEEYAALLTHFKENSLRDTGISVSPSDHTVTLATCTTTGDEKRMLVCAVRVGEIVR